jgi:hypothetical protein
MNKICEGVKMSKVRNFFAMVLLMSGISSAVCYQSTISTLVVNPSSGSSEPDFAGMARIILTSDPTCGFYVAPDQTTFKEIYSMMLAAFMAGSKVEVCIESGSAPKGVYYRISRISLQK